MVLRVSGHDTLGADLKGSTGRFNLDIDGNSARSAWASL